MPPPLPILTKSRKPGNYGKAFKRFLPLPGQSMQESPEASPRRLLRLRCGFPGLVGQQGCQFPPFLALHVQPPAQIVNLPCKLLPLPFPFEFDRGKAFA
jgi:hypothetical protein